MHLRARARASACNFKSIVVFDNHIVIEHIISMVIKRLQMILKKLCDFINKTIDFKVTLKIILKIFLISLYFSCLCKIYMYVIQIVDG